MSPRTQPRPLTSSRDRSAPVPGRPIGSRSIRTVVSVSIGIAMLAPLGCGSDSGDGGTTPDEGNPDAPVVRIASPSDAATISGDVTITATAERATRVTFSVDGIDVATDEEAPFSTTWASGSVSDGTHRIAARATNDAGTDDDAVDVTVDNDGVAIAVSVAPSDAIVRLGESLTLTATVVGTDATDVTWSVVESGRGTVSASGVFTAPGSLPDPPTATVRATSVAAPSVSGSVTIDLTESGMTTNERRVASSMFGAGEDASEFLSESIDLVAQAVFLASELSGDPEGTLVGTLTQIGGPDSETFTYDPTPTDRLVVVLSGLSVPLEFVVRTFIGDISSTWESFRDYHDDLDFDVKLGSVVDVAIRSVWAGPGPRKQSIGRHDAHAVRRTLTQYGRTFRGTIEYQGEPHQLDLTFESEIDSEVSGSSATYDTYQTALGTVQSPLVTFQVAEAYRYKSIYVDNFVTNSHLWNETQASFGGATFKYAGVYVRRETTNGSIGDPGYWHAEGTLDRNGSPIGTVVFVTPPQVGLPGVAAGVQLADGEVVPIETVVGRHGPRDELRRWHRVRSGT